MSTFFHLLRSVQLLLLALNLLILGCTRPENREDGGMLTIKGSDTMVHLVAEWTERYSEDHPGANISVTGGGSGTGIAALINGSTDICMSSREMTEEEQQQAQSRGVSLQEMVVGRDGIVIAVHPGNPIESLCMEELEKIFTGATARWSELGGPDHPITVLSREVSSGTYVFFQEHVLNKKDFTSAARLLPANTSIVQALQTDQWSIGYIGLGYAEKAGESVKVLPITQEAGGSPVTPDTESILSGVYPIARTLLFYLKEPQTGTARSFAEFCVSPAGQEIVRAAGYVPLN